MLGSFSHHIFQVCSILFHWASVGMHTQTSGNGFCIFSSRTGENTFFLFYQLLTYPISLGCVGYYLHCVLQIFKLKNPRYFMRSRTCFMWIHSTSFPSSSQTVTTSSPTLSTSTLAFILTVRSLFLLQVSFYLPCPWQHC